MAFKRERRSAVDVANGVSFHLVSGRVGTAALVIAALACACRAVIPVDPAVPIVRSRQEFVLTAGSKPFLLPVDVAADVGRRELLVADRGTRRVEIFDEQGAYLRSFGQRGGGFVRFRDLSAIDVDPQGRVLCVDPGLGAILTVDSIRGAVVDQVPLRGAPPGPGVVRQAGAAGRGFVVDPARGVVEVHDARGALVGLLGDETGAPLRLDGPAGLALDSRGRLVIAETGARRVQVRSLPGGP